MKVKILTALFGFSLMYGAAFAALPPLWQNVAELKAILADKQLGEQLQSGEAIVDIKKTSAGWMVITNQHELPIEVDDTKPSMPGPAPFILKFGKARSLQ